MAEDAALSLDPSDGSHAMSTFDQLQKHGQIRCEKIGNKYIFVYLSRSAKIFVNFCFIIKVK